MLNGRCSSAKVALARIGFLFFLAWMPALQANALADSAKDSERKAKTKAAKSVKGMRLMVSANGRYFVDQDGKPFFYLGDTCWVLFQRLDHKEVEEYLKDRAGK